MPPGRRIPMIPGKHSSAAPWRSAQIPGRGGFPAAGRRAGFGGLSSGREKSQKVTNVSVSATYRFGRVNPENTKFDSINLGNIGKLLTYSFNRLGFQKDTSEWAMYYLMQWFILRLYYRTPVGPANTGQHLRDMWRMQLRAGSATQIGFRLFNDMTYASFVEFGTHRFEGRHMLSRTVRDAEMKLRAVKQRLITPEWLEFVRKNTAAGKKVLLNIPGGMQDEFVTGLEDFRKTFGLAEPFEMSGVLMTPREVLSDIQNTNAWLILRLPDPESYREGKTKGGVTDFKAGPTGSRNEYRRASGVATTSGRRITGTGTPGPLPHRGVNRSSPGRRGFGQYGSRTGGNRNSTFRRD